jgi:hypothetical protein
MILAHCTLLSTTLKALAAKCKHSKFHFAHSRYVLRTLLLRTKVCSRLQSIPGPSD